MNTAIENLIKQTLALVLAALITGVMANSISQLAGTDISGKSYQSTVTATLVATRNATAAG
jgi:hypothetical protein